MPVSLDFFAPSNFDSTARPPAKRADVAFLLCSLELTLPRSHFLLTRQRSSFLPLGNIFVGQNISPLYPCSQLALPLTLLPPYPALAVMYCFSPINYFVYPLKLCTCTIRRVISASTAAGILLLSTHAKTILQVSQLTMDRKIVLQGCRDGFAACYDLFVGSAAAAATAAGPPTERETAAAEGGRFVADIAALTR